MIVHVLVTVVFNVSPLPLRIASVIIPLLFGFIASPFHKISLNGAFVLALFAAALSVQAMLMVTGVHDRVPIFPGSWVEWREVLEYGASIFLAFISGNILGLWLFHIFPYPFSRRQAQCICLQDREGSRS